MFFKTLNFEALVYSLFLSYDVRKFLKNRFSACHVSIFVCVCVYLQYCNSDIFCNFKRKAY